MGAMKCSAMVVVLLQVFVLALGLVAASDGTRSGIGQRGRVGEVAFEEDFAKVTRELLLLRDPPARMAMGSLPSPENAEMDGEIPAAESTAESEQSVPSPTSFKPVPSSPILPTGQPAPGPAGQFGVQIITPPSPRSPGTITACDNAAGCGGSYAQLSHFVAEGSTEKVKELIDDGAPTYLEDSHVEIPLHVAAMKNLTAIAKILLDANASVNIEDEEGWTPLMIASRYGSHAVAELLISAGADVAATREEDGQGPLHYAVSVDAHMVVLLIIEAGADINAPNSKGETPVWLAAYYGSIESLRTLIQRGANPATKSKDNSSPQDIICSCNSVSDATRLPCATEECSETEFWVVIQSILEEGF